jgi:hypothetical protein
LNPCREARYLPIMKKKILTRKLTLSQLTLKELIVDQVACAKGGAELPRTSLRPDCGCA